jgi:pyridoxamine 5'-phosphate oxidase
VVRYFDTEGQQHHRDEDEDLFPLLRALTAERGRADVAAVMEELEREHASMDRQWSRLREGLAGLAEGQGGVLDSDEVMRFAWLYRRHMKYEAAVVIPFAREALSAEQRAGFASRMAERRGLPA